MNSLQEKIIGRCWMVLLCGVSCFAQTQEARIFFWDGDSLDGYAMLAKRNLTPLSKSVDIKFRLALDAKPDTWTSEDIKRIVFFGDGMTRTFEFMRFGKHAFDDELVEVLAKGEVTLYARVGWRANVVRENPGISNDLGEPAKYSPPKRLISGVNDSEFIQHDFRIDEEKMNYYLKRFPGDKPFEVGTPMKNWAKCAIEYFADCPWLVKKINNHEFLKSQMKEIVESYNDICRGE
jgi:hypothetical protein